MRIVIAIIAAALAGCATPNSPNYNDVLNIAQCAGKAAREMRGVIDPTREAAIRNECMRQMNLY